MYVKQLDLFVTVKLLEDTPAVLSLGKLCEDHGSSYEWTSGQKPQLIKDGRRIKCSKENCIPIVVPGLSTSSSSSATRTSSTSALKEAVVPTWHSASARSESTSGAVRVSPSHEPAEVERSNKNEDDERVRGDPLRDLPEWLEEFTENPVDEIAPEHRDEPASSSRESASEPRGKVVSGKHSIHTHFPKDKHCDICMRTKITRALCRKRTGTAVLRAEKFGDLIPADQKVLGEGCESRTIIDMLSWYTIWQLNEFNLIRAEPKLFR